MEHRAVEHIVAVQDDVARLGAFLAAVIDKDRAVFRVFVLIGVLKVMLIVLVVVFMPQHGIIDRRIVHADPADDLFVDLLQRVPVLLGQLFTLGRRFLCVLAIGDLLDLGRDGGILHRRKDKVVQYIHQRAQKGQYRDQHNGLAHYGGTAVPAVGNKREEEVLFFLLRLFFRAARQPDDTVGIIQTVSCQDLIRLDNSLAQQGFGGRLRQTGVRRDDKNLFAVQKAVAAVAHAQIPQREDLDLGRHAGVRLVRLKLRLQIRDQLIEQLAERRAVGSVQRVGKQKDIGGAVLQRFPHGVAELFRAAADVGFVADFYAARAQRRGNALKAPLQQIIVRSAFSD